MFFQKVKHFMEYNFKGKLLPLPSIIPVSYLYYCELLNCFMVWKCPMALSSILDLCKLKIYYFEKIFWSTKWSLTISMWPWDVVRSHCIIRHEETGFADLLNMVYCRIESVNWMNRYVDDSSANLRIITFSKKGKQ